MKKEAPENEASYLSHGLRGGLSLFETICNRHLGQVNAAGRPYAAPEGRY